MACATIIIDGMTLPAPGPSEFRQPSEKVDLGPIFARLLEGGTLSAAETTKAFEAMVGGRTHEAEVGALLALLARRVPTADELLGAARVMRAHVDAVPTSRDPDAIVDTAGTGGAPKTFNVSTVAAVIAAAAGDGRFGVAKHGNRSRTGRGSAEVLAALGVNVDAPRDVQARCLDEHGLCFCFAIHHHPATRHVIGARKALGFATIFNLLGPLTNPAGATRQVMGVYADRFVRPIAEALLALGATRAMVVHSRDGLDELTLTAPTRVAHVEHGRVHEEEIDPSKLGLGRASFADLQARDLPDAAGLFRAIVEGREQGPRRDMALLNASATLVVAGRADSFREGLMIAARAIESGAAAATLRALTAASSDGD
jgi:anthranilate phosphoribosyltransferase